MDNCHFSPSISSSSSAAAAAVASSGNINRGNIHPSHSNLPTATEISNTNDFWCMLFLLLVTVVVMVSARRQRVSRWRQRHATGNCCVVQTNMDGAIAKINHLIAHQYECQHNAILRHSFFGCRVAKIYFKILEEIPWVSSLKRLR